MCAMDQVREVVADLRRSNQDLRNLLDVKHAVNVVAALCGNYVELRWLEKDYEQGERDLAEDWWSRNAQGGSE